VGGRVEGQHLLQLVVLCAAATAAVIVGCQNALDLTL